MDKMPLDYNKTLNLPKTDFPMRAGLPQMESKRLDQWQENEVYEKLIEKNKDKELYILHDGPPYANGDIHLGTALNKTLKDIIVRYKNMSGFNAPFVPGWDTHGLPTELRARKKAGLKNAALISDLELRKMCREFALSYVNDQRSQFKRLGCLGEWDNPYITLQKKFEATQVEIFAKMASQGHIYKGLKPVYWCTDCKTALAEAEIEYSEDPCTSIYVKFKVTDDKGKFTDLGIDKNKVYFVIWTTTTWTLPGNVAISLGPNFDYNIVKCADEYYVIAKDLTDKAMSAAKIENYQIVSTFKGKDLEFMKTQHPFLQRESLVIVGDHVTLETGTGCVHTAPGHGLEDFDVCQNYDGLPIVVPVDANGRLTKEAGVFEGLKINEANEKIQEHLQEKRLLFSKQEVIHQYPHCWRCKKPVLFRATEQWFCSVEDLKKDAIKAIQDVEWIPSWGENRITPMVRDRKDWCISRQRKWGVPIPIFYCEDCNEPLIDYDAMMSVSKVFAKHGADSWYELEAKDFLPKETKCKKCGGTSFLKEKDIMDVWFDSGVTHAAVLKKRDNLRWPADLYLEGADQYRGWFQSSLLTSIATTGKAPYKAVVTNGWVVDGNGRKMSKSLGNGILPSDIVDKYGADILRLWVASSDYHADIRISDNIIKQLCESYRKIRNTARFILGNLFDFNPNTHIISENDLLPIDKLAIYKLNELSKKVKNAYDRFEFHQVYHAIHNFCVVDMSNFYLDVIKDRLYVEKQESAGRRSAQTAMYKVIDSLVRLVSPILPYTADEIWDYMPHKDGDDTDNIVFNSLNDEQHIDIDENFVSKWDKIQVLRSEAQKALEIARTKKVIGKALEAAVEISCGGDLYNFINSVKDELKTVFIVSEVNLNEGNNGDYKAERIENLYLTIYKAKGEKCERCWTHSKTVGENNNHKTLCSRCVSVIDE
jgi:isoleucyl-tRNA synthetase